MRLFTGNEEANKSIDSTSYISDMKMKEKNKENS